MFPKMLLGDQSPESMSSRTQTLTLAELAPPDKVFAAPEFKAPAMRPVNLLSTRLTPPPTLPANGAACVDSTSPLSITVQTAPTPSPKAHEVIIRTRALGLSPLSFPFPSTTSSIPGNDVSGEIAAIGGGVRPFEVGERVLGLAVAGAWQAYVPVAAHLIAPIPGSLSFERAAVIPHGFATAAAALFGPEGLGLSLPSIESVRLRRTLLVWHAASAAGCSAVQLAVAAGYAVVAACERRNAALARRLGAVRVLDVASDAVVRDAAAVLRGSNCVGAYVAAEGGVQSCCDVLRQADGAAKVVVTVGRESEDMEGVAVEGVAVRAAHHSALAVDRHLATALFADWLPKALALGKFVPAPDADVVGHGLGALQAAMRELDVDGPARKVVVTV